MAETPSTEEQNDSQSTQQTRQDAGTMDDAQNVQSALDKLRGTAGPEQMQAVMAAMMSGTAAATNPLHNKMDSSHITAVLKIAADHDEREYELQKQAQNLTVGDETQKRRYSLAALAIVLIALLIILYIFRDKPSVLIPIASGLFGLGSGFLGGWGYGKHSTDE